MTTGTRGEQVNDKTNQRKMGILIKFKMIFLCFQHDSYYENLSDLPVDDFELWRILNMTHTAKYQQLVGFGGRKDFH